MYEQLADFFIKALQEDPAMSVFILYLCVLGFASSVRSSVRTCRKLYSILKCRFERFSSKKSNRNISKQY